MHLAICGYKGSGKDFAASIINKRYGFDIVAFADPIRYKIMDIFKLDSENEYDVFKRKLHTISGKDVHGRDIVRDTAMFVREYNDNAFTDYVGSQLYRPVVISDLRFDIEYNFCKSNDFIVIQVLNNNTCSDGHESETITFTPDYCIENTNDENFEIQLIKLIDEIITNCLTQ